MRAIPLLLTVSLVLARARDRYPTIAEFYPRLLEVFQEASSSSLLSHASK